MSSRIAAQVDPSDAYSGYQLVFAATDKGVESVEETPNQKIGNVLEGRLKGSLNNERGTGTDGTPPQITHLQQPLSEQFPPQAAELPLQPTPIKRITFCAFLPLLVPGMLEASATAALLERDASVEDELSEMLTKRNLFYGSLPFIAYGMAALLSSDGSSFGGPILIGGTALAVKNLTNLHQMAKTYQDRWIG